MGEFVFKTDENARDFCLEIASIMMSEFKIKHDEAIGRINSHWGHLPSIIDRDIIFHIHPGEWAFLIYFGPDVQNKIGIDYTQLKPLPYPEED
jgi:hypothetical protein